MSRCQQVGQPILRSIRQQSYSYSATTCSIRYFTSTPRRRDDRPTLQTGSEPQNPIEVALLGATPLTGVPSKAWTPEQMASFTSPEHGSRRRRAAMATSGNIPFEQLPYQCFQEARKILAEDRAEKIAKIAATMTKIKHTESKDASQFRGGEHYRQKRLAALRTYVDELKVLADINDPIVKRRFEDGKGDMTKPVYRYLAEKKWHAMDHKIIKQRIHQFHIVPDILPKFEPTVDLKLSFRSSPVQPGAILDSAMTEVPPAIRMQVFDKGERLMTIAVIDSDVPDAESDGFKWRCHFLAANIPWDPTKTHLALRHIGVRAEGDVAVPWLPPHSQLGSPYHRLSVFVLQQRPDETLDVAQLKELYDGDAESRKAFGIKGLRDRFGLEPVGFNMFRTVWDDNTAAVMERHGIPGADIEFRRARVTTMKQPRKAKGWEAKRQKPKYRSLWKYSKRIA
ncbi:putative ribosomal protein [Lasiosphaeria miniovina]|uniref:Large ribosomal subunit protein mL38 n=1 Tax=Lasiosphaeria miniovina TaxID=1954250 RepID=A0AA40EAF7_9PEZI|nr:putative ribosomal protein [Lasiosphaeria miniovina]KAK0728283.1 putative ribosomal protein [Lasiosphaeria miniovina]